MLTINPKTELTLERGTHFLNPNIFVHIVGAHSIEPDYQTFSLSNLQTIEQPGCRAEETAGCFI